MSFPTHFLRSALFIFFSVLLFFFLRWALISRPHAQTHAGGEFSRGCRAAHLSPGVLLIPTASPPSPPTRRRTFGATHNRLHFKRNEQNLMSRTSQSGDLPQWGFFFSPLLAWETPQPASSFLCCCFVFWILSQLLIWNTWEYGSLCNINLSPLLCVLYKLGQLTVNTLAQVFVCQLSRRCNKDGPFAGGIVSGQKKRHVQQTVGVPLGSE